MESKWVDLSLNSFVADIENNLFEAEATIIPFPFHEGQTKFIDKIESQIQLIDEDITLFAKPF